MLTMLPNNPINRKKGKLAYATPTATLRHYKFVLKNSCFVNFKNHNYPVILFFGRCNEEGIVRNLAFENSSYTDT